MSSIIGGIIPSMEALEVDLLETWSTYGGKNIQLAVILLWQSHVSIDKNRVFILRQEEYGSALARRYCVAKCEILLSLT